MKKKVIDIIRMVAFFVAFMAVMLMCESDWCWVPVLVLGVCGWQLEKVDTTQFRCLNEYINVED